MFLNYQQHRTVNTCIWTDVFENGELKRKTNNEETRKTSSKIHFLFYSVLLFGNVSERLIKNVFISSF